MDFNRGMTKNMFLAMLKQGFIFWMRGGQPFKSDSYHMFVVLNYEPKSGEAILLINGTSQVDKRLDYLRKTRINIDDTTVIFEAGAYDFMSKRTIFDCNAVMQINMMEMFLGNEIMFIGDELVEEDVAKLIRAVVASDKVLPEYKRLIDVKYNKGGT